MKIKAILTFMLLVSFFQIKYAMSTQQYGDYILTTIKEDDRCIDFRLLIKDAMTAGYPDSVAIDQINQLASSAKSAYCAN